MLFKIKHLKRIIDSIIINLSFILFWILCDFKLVVIVFTVVLWEEINMLTVNNKIDTLYNL